MGEERSNDRMLALAETFRAFAEVTRDYTRLLDTVAKKTTELIGDGCVVMLVGDDGSFSGPGAGYARDPAAIEHLRAAMARLPDEAGPGLARGVAATGESVLLPVVESEQLARMAQPAFASAVRALGIWSFLSVPLEVGGTRLGALSMIRYRADSPPFDEGDRTLARGISDHAALAISNAQLFESLQQELRERKKAEEKAKTFVALIENSTDLIAMADFQGRLLFCNAAGRALVGLGPDHDVGKLTLADFVPENWQERRPMIEGGGSWQGESVLRHFCTGEVMPVQVSTFLVRDTEGKPLCFASVQHDLRETKRLETELRDAQKMEALGRLAGGVAHDFNNLLTVILSYCAMLARTMEPQSRSAHDVKQIDRAGQRAAELTKQLLAFSRRQVLEPKPLDLGAAVRSMEDMMRRLIGEDIELKINLSASSSCVMADSGQVEQVVMNLVVNARDAMPRGGVLTVETAHVSLPAGAFHMLAVTDTGAGIDEQTRAHLFEPFFTTKDRGKGTGLGLSTVMGIVEQSGGHVSVDSEVGRGTTFRVYLPATSEPVRGAGPAPAIATSRGNERILVVEDEVEVRVLVRDVLREAGYEVTVASDGEHALAVVRADARRIDLLLTDVIMPKMSGRELAAKFLELRPGTRVLYMSGYTDDKLGHHGVLDPDVELVQKPLTPDILRRRVRARLG
ncbi:MAG: ATP-binding protein [Polyangiales bacterium]